MAVAKYIGLVIAGVAAAAVFVVLALLVLGAVIWLLAAAADFLASFQSGRRRRSGPAQPG